MELNGKVALITGGAVRLGRVLALKLAASGARLVVHYHRSAQAAEELVATIKAGGGEAAVLCADLRQAGQTAGAILTAAQNRFGPPDFLINNAAVFEPGTLGATTEANWDAHFDVNLKAPFFLSQAFAAGRARAGHIVNIVDWRGRRADPNYQAYSLTKAGLIALTESLAKDLAPQIQVNAIAPGAVMPPPGGSPDDLARYAQGIPMRKAGSPADVAEALLFLLKSEFLTGQVIYVAGGQHL